MEKHLATLYHKYTSVPKDFFWKHAFSNYNSNNSGWILSETTLASLSSFTFCSNVDFIHIQHKALQHSYTSETPIY